MVSYYMEAGRRGLRNYAAGLLRSLVLVCQLVTIVDDPNFPVNIFERRCASYLMNIESF